MRQPCTMQLVIQADGMEAFPIQQDFEINTNQWPDPGDLLSVTFDREHHDRIEIDWSAVPTSGEVAAQHAAELAAQLNAAPQAPPAQPAVSDASIDELERLAKLHSEGALTDEEFASLKAKLLGS